jgi:hypothetical protein
MSNLTPSELFTLVLINSDSYWNLELPLKSLKQKQLEKKIIFSRVLEMKNPAKNKSCSLI